MKKISFGLTKSAAWIAAGLIIGAGVGTGVGFLVVNLVNKNDDKSFGRVDSIQNVTINDYGDIKIWEYPTNNLRESIFGSKTQTTLSDNKQIKIWDGNGYKDSNNNGPKYSVVDLGLYTLAYKIKTRLGFGPEIKRLKEIKITPKGNWSEANGVYFGGSNEIIINSTNIIDALNRAEQSLGDFSPEQEIEFVSEYVFQIIAHEYNHHIAYSYLNSRFADASQNQYFQSNPQSVDVKNTVKPETENWDKDFYDTFVKTLNYDGSDTTKDYGFWRQMQSVPDKWNNEKTTIYTPMSKYFTSSDIFKYANDKNVTNITHKAGYGIPAATWNDKLNYAFYKDGPVAVNYTKDMLSYNFSLAELFARKVQQLTMPLATNFTRISTGEEYPIPRYRGVKLESDGTTSSADSEIFGIDQLVWGSAKGTYSPFILDTKNYADDWRSYPFTSDYLYYGSKTNPTDYSNAEKIYAAILQEMGYSGNNVFDNEGKVDKTQQADISTIWWKNDETVQTDGTMHYPSKTNYFNMGGYVNNKVESIGYIENGNYFKLANVKTSTFSLEMKKELATDEKFPLKYTRTTDGGIHNENDQYFWTLDGYYDIRNFIGHDLVFTMTKTSEQKDVELALLNSYTTGERRAHERPSYFTDTNDTAQTDLHADKENVINNDKSSWNFLEKVVDEKGSEITLLDPLEYIPLTTYNSEATTWLSSDSQEQRSGINEMIARPHYGTDDKSNLTYGIRLQLFDKDDKEVK